MLATLTSLRIRNLALVEDLTWQPGTGLVAITGETGAGKSILIGALQLLLGERADRSLIRSGADSCTVEAAFDVGDSNDLNILLEERGAEICNDGQLLLKRTLSVAGAGRQFVNGSPCTLAALKELGDLLVDLHGPHDHQSLFSREAQVSVLDAYAGATAQAAGVADAHREERRLAAEVEDLRAKESDAAMRREMLSHVAGEIAAAKLSQGEEEDLMARLRTAGNSRRLLEIVSQMQSALGGDGESAPALAGVIKLARELARLDPGAENLCGQAEALAAGLSELERECEGYAEKIDSDPSSLRELEERADLLLSLKRKYGGTLAEVIARGEKAAMELEEIETRGDRIAELEKARDAAVEKTTGLAKKLSALRTRAAPALAKAVTRELSGLGFPQSSFEVRLEAASKPGPGGNEIADFVFAPNPGEPAKPLRAIASSGEISRVMLALKSVLAGKGGVPLLVFDEIDANVGGEIAVRVGQKMRALASAHQVFCITHLPQVAAAAQRQFVVRKGFDGERTTSSVEESGGEDRVRELARMLGGHDSKSAMDHARNLLASHG